MPGSAGYDLFWAENIELKQNSLQKISADISLKIPKGNSGMIRPRSSYTLKFTGIGDAAIDSDFRGNISRIFFNFLNKFYQVNIGDRIAQIVFEKISMPLVEEVYELKEKTERNTVAFGSTGFWKKWVRK